MHHSEQGILAAACSSAWTQWQDAMGTQEEERQRREYHKAVDKQAAYFRRRAVSYRQEHGDPGLFRQPSTLEQLYRWEVEKEREMDRQNRKLQERD